MFYKFFIPIFVKIYIFIFFKQKKKMCMENINITRKTFSL